MRDESGPEASTIEAEPHPSQKHDPAPRGTGSVRDSGSWPRLRSAPPTSTQPEQPARGETSRSRQGDRARLTEEETQRDASRRRSKLGETSDESMGSDADRIAVCQGVAIEGPDSTRSHNGSKVEKDHGTRDRHGPCSARMAGVGSWRTQKNCSEQVHVVRSSAEDHGSVMHRHRLARSRSVGDREGLREVVG